MPILVAPADSVSLADGDPIIRIVGLPDFNPPGDNTFFIEDVENWWNTAPPRTVLVPNGGGPGSVASGDWGPTEEYITLTGGIQVGPGQQEDFRRLLLAGLPANVDVPLIYVGNGWDRDKQMFVRRYDRPTITKEQAGIFFSFPLVATDPLKYALEPLTGTMGVFAGQTWFGEYTDQGAGLWTRPYGFNGSQWVRTFTQAASVGPWPDVLTLDSAGDTMSQRLTVTVIGPVAAGDWWLLNETTGARMWVDLSVADDGALVLDCGQRTAYLNGANVDHLVYGDWLTLESGGNTFRLSSGTHTNASATVSALEAYL